MLIEMERTERAESPPTRILLVRHGECAGNREGRFRGRVDFPLNETGLAQARALAGALKSVPLDRIFTSQEEVLSMVEKSILFFRDQGITGERFADTIARIGFAEVQRQLLSDDLLKNKEANLAAQKHLAGGATC